MAVNEIYRIKDKEKRIWNLSKCRYMDKTQATAFPYLRFILLNGESLSRFGAAGRFFE